MILPIKHGLADPAGHVGVNAPGTVSTGGMLPAHGLADPAGHVGVNAPGTVSSGGMLPHLQAAGHNAGELGKTYAEHFSAGRNDTRANRFRHPK